MFNLNEGLWYYIVNVANDGLPKEKYILLTLGFALISIAAGYLLGSINSAILVSRLKYGEDIRKFGSGNAGMTNMLRTYGKGAAALTALGDVMKTVIAIFIGCLLGGFGYMGGISVGGLYCELPLGYIAGFFSIVGHILPLYYGFKGGKGVLCTAAMALVLTPVEFAVLFVVFVLIVYFSRYISLGSVSVAFLYPMVVSFHIRLAFSGANAQNGIMALITIVIAIIVIYCHRGNLKRISEGTERKLSIGSRKGNGDGTDSK
ncbi:MAG: glycerol-3-phosphate 1-O-acyltransferase PlsY [Ruminococcaceae bacterium]|nr:glycerol-3-phosphate 1-O-acyltransferase PlsY [Oscillospiraceae bacterium]